MLTFLSFVALVCIAVMLANTPRRRSHGDFPFFGFAAFVLLFISVPLIQLHLFGTVDTHFFLTYLSRKVDFWSVVLVIVGYLFFGACYSLFMWRFRVLPEVKARIADLLQRWNTREEVLNIFCHEFYVPEDNQNLILPQLSYHSGYLIWLIWFWPFDFAACILGNWMKYLFVDLPHLIGSLVYNIIKAQFEQIARNFLK